MEEDQNLAGNLNPTPPVSRVEQTPAGQSPLGGATASKPKPKFPLAVTVGLVLFFLIAISAAGFYAFKPQIMKLISKPTPTPRLIIKVSPTPIPDSTANWETYSSSSYSIKYPPDFYMVPSSQRGGADYIGDSKNSTDTYLNRKPLTQSMLILTFIDLQTAAEFNMPAGTIIPNTDKNLQQLVNKKFGTYTTGGYSTVAYDPISIGGAKGARVVANNSVNYLVPSKENYIWTSAQPHNSNKISTFEQMMSTLKFTDSQTTTTANWKTYKNDKLGFSFMYPPTFTLSDINSKPDSGQIYSTGQCATNETINLLSIDYTDSLPKSIELYKQSNTFSPGSEFKEISFKGFNGVKSYYQGSSQTGGPQVQLFFVRNNKGFEITYRFCGKPITTPNETQINDIKPDILSTFKFTDNQTNTSGQIPIALGNFPIYPGAIFVEKKSRIRCAEAAPPRFVVL